MDFPFGKAPLAILLLAAISGVAVLIFGASAAPSAGRPDLIFATFTKEHAVAYANAIAEFERQNHVRVQVQVVSQPALQGRLQSSMAVGAAVPDMVELLDGTLGVFTMGPVEDVGFVDLTPRVRAAGLMEKLVTSRFGKWSSRGHVFALPHDVHPVMLAYRRDLVESLGIDVNTLTTWDEFARVGREVVTKDMDGDGVADRYMLDLPSDGGDVLRFMFGQSEIEYDETRVVGGETPQGLLAGSRDYHVIAGRDQARTQEAMDLRLVVDDEYADGLGHEAASLVHCAAGSSIAMLVPLLPSAGLLARMVPPICSMTRLQMVRPSPVPCRSRSPARTR